MDDRAAAGLTIAAVILVVFSALIDPRLTVVLATILIGVGAIYTLRRTSRG